MKYAFKLFCCSCSVSLLCLIGLGDLASADDTDYAGPYAKLVGGLNLTLDSNFDGSPQNSFPSGEANLDSGFITGLSGGYRFSRNFAAELDYAYRSNDIGELKGSGGNTLADGRDLASVAIMANGYYFLDISECWSPYVGLGMGFLQEIDSDVQLRNLPAQSDLEDQVFAWQAMIGVEVPLDSSWRIYGEGRFMSAPSPKLSNDRGSYSVDYDNISLLLGVGYQF